MARVRRTELVVFRQRLLDALAAGDDKATDKARADYLAAEQEAGAARASVIEVALLDGLAQQFGEIKQPHEGVKLGGVRYAGAEREQRRTVQVVGYVNLADLAEFVAAAVVTALPDQEPAPEMIGLPTEVEREWADPFADEPVDDTTRCRHCGVHIVYTIPGQKGNGTEPSWRHLVTGFKACDPSAEPTVWAEP